MSIPKKVIPGPDIDKLAQGIYGPQNKMLLDMVSDLTGANKVLRVEAKKLRKQLRGALRHNETLLDHMAAAKKSRQALIAENNRLKARLLNEGIDL